MLGQLDESYSRLSHFSADIAHELRTPLTNVITQTQVALGSARSAEAYRELLHSNLEEMERLARMVSDMLWLAQADRGLITPTFETVDLAAEARSLLEYFELLTEEKRVELKLLGSTLCVRGDRPMLRRALPNLLSNAVRHAPEGGRVTVLLVPDGEGSGLGLAIVRSIVSLHGGNVSVSSSDGLTTFTMTYPRSPGGGNEGLQHVSSEAA